jgi:hypothetical protein
MRRRSRSLVGNALSPSQLHISREVVFAQLGIPERYGRKRIRRLFRDDLEEDDIDNVIR